MRRCLIKIAAIYLSLFNLKKKKKLAITTHKKYVLAHMNAFVCVRACVCEGGRGNCTSIFNEIFKFIHNIEKVDNPCMNNTSVSKNLRKFIPFVLYIRIYIYICIYKYIIAPNH